jgi:hypothetical protein
MRKFTFFLMLMTILFVLSPQKPFAQPYTDDFESYTAGGYIAVQNPTWWTTWSGAPGSGEDGQISTDYASSGTKSVLLDLVPGSSDLILKLGDKTSGVYEVNFDFYVESGYSGYFNIQHYQTPGVQWAYEVYFHTNGTGALYAGSGTPITFSYPKNAWFEVVNHINIDSDLASLYVNGVLVYSWPFHYTSYTTTGTNQLGGVDFFAGSEGSDTPKAYFDDIAYVPIAPAAFIEIGNGTGPATIFSI